MKRIWLNIALCGYALCGILSREICAKEKEKPQSQYTNISSFNLVQYYFLHGISLLYLERYNKSESVLLNAASLAKESNLESDINIIQSIHTLLAEGQRHQKRSPDAIEKLCHDVNRCSGVYFVLAKHYIDRNLPHIGCEYLSKVLKINQFHESGRQLSSTKAL